MLDDRLYFIDANIPMYAAGADHPLKKPCIAILDQIARGQINAVSDSDVIQEILHRYTSLGQRQRAIEVCRIVLSLIPVWLAPRRDDMEMAVTLHAQHSHLQARDSVHAAIVLGHQIRYIVSADRHFDGLPGIERIDPSTWTSTP